MTSSDFDVAVTLLGTNKYGMMFPHSPPVEYAIVFDTMFDYCNHSCYFVICYLLLRTYSFFYLIFEYACARHCD